MKVLILVALFAMLVAACASDDTGGSDTTTAPPTTSPAEVQDVAIEDVATLDDGTFVRVSGALFITQNTRLCGTVLESYPPQCGDPFVVLDGLDAENVVGLSSPEDPTFAPITWTDFPLTIVGTVKAGSIEVSDIDQPLYTSEPDEDLFVRLGVNAPAGLTAGELVWWSLDITNTTSAPTTLVFTSGKQADVTLTDESGGMAYQWSEDMMFIQSISSVDLAPGATFSAVLSGELTVPAGEYAIEGFFTTPMAEPAVASGTVTIER